jgi:hypothetical protein
MYRDFTLALLIGSFDADTLTHIFSFSFQIVVTNIKR